VQRLALAFSLNAFGASVVAVSIALSNNLWWLVFAAGAFMVVMSALVAVVTCQAQGRNP
jgi:hypothetical protein